MGGKRLLSTRPPPLKWGILVYSEGRLLTHSSRSNNSRIVVVWSIQYLATEYVEGFMEECLKFFAKLQHWHLFILISVPMLVAGVFFRPDIGMHVDLATFSKQFTTMMLISLPSYVAWYGWLWSIGIVGNSSLSDRLRRSDRLAWFSSPIVLAYLTVAIWTFPVVMFDPEPSALQTIMIVLHLIASFLMIYAFFFAARAAASLGQSSKPSGGRVFLFFLGIMYFPIGVWIIQPRLNLAAMESNLDR